MAIFKHRFHFFCSVLDVAAWMCDCKCMQCACNTHCAFMIDPMIRKRQSFDLCAFDRNLAVTEGVKKPLPILFVVAIAMKAINSDSGRAF